MRSARGRARTRQRRSPHRNHSRMASRPRSNRSRAVPVGCQKSARPVSCSDGPGSAVRHHDHRCSQANAFHKRFASARYRPGSRWDLVVNIEPDQARDGIGQFFERAAWFYEASGLGEGMAHPAPGLGQAYLGGYTDRNGQWLDGARDYRLVVPPDPPARQFWSVCIYDALTRTIPDNTTKIAEISSRTNPVTNPDGSIELRFGPQPPADTSQSNWIQTIPGRAWFAYLRLYGPTESYFDRSWPLGDIHPA